MKFPIDETQIAAIVDKAFPIGHEGDQDFVTDVWRRFIPVINGAYESGRRDALKEMRKDGGQA